jgi:phosphatidylserine/phosphatidylglycerophosphate/cardiolipin synthase-like enzyme
VVSVFLGNYEGGSAIAKGLLINGVNPEVPMGFEVRCGTGLGEFIMGRVRNGSEVIVASPWLSPEVARELVELSKRARVTVITTNNMENQSHVRALNELCTVERAPAKQAEELTRGRKVKYILAKLARLVLIILMIITLTPIPIPGSDTMYETRVYPRVSELIVLDRSATKLHAKLIVLPSEGLVGIGSANLTFSGLQSNAECWVWLSSPEAVETAMNFVDRLLKQPRQDLSSVAEIVEKNTEGEAMAKTILDFLPNTHPQYRKEKT